MPYKTDDQLPENLRNILPLHAQHIYRKAFNHAWEEYKDPNKRRANKADSREAISRAIAWSAVERKYIKDKETGRWKPKH